MMSNNTIPFVEQLIASGEYEKAETACLDLLNENENNSEAFNKLGEICLYRGKYIEAQIFFEKAVKENGENYFAIINLADLHKNSSGKQTADNFLEGIIDTTCKNINDMIKLALACEKKKKYDFIETICSIINIRFSENLEVSEILKRVKNYYSLFYVVFPQVNNESELGKYLYDLVDIYKPRVILDIGAATGLGSTKILAESVKQLNLKAKIYAVEAQEETFNNLKINISEYSFVEPILGTFINIKTIPCWETVISDIRTYGKVLLENYSENEILNWFDNNYAILNNLSCMQKDVKLLIRDEIFDLVFFDSGEFFAKEELKEFINKTNIVVLDDINTYKNSFNNQYLLNHPDWIQIKCSTNERNGWSAFKRKNFLMSNINMNNELINSVYVNQDIEVFYDEKATDLLFKNNDKKYLTNEGIIKVDKERWEQAQKYEKKTWMHSCLDSNDDRNFEHRVRFNNYDSLKSYKFENVIELGCGPFTNLRIILQDIKTVKKISLLDPLIKEYLKHPNCSYKDGVLLGTPVKIINSPIEEFVPIEKYDLVVMNNVLEHCYDIPKIFNIITSLLNDRGVFVFADVAFNSEQVRIISEKQYDAGHPIRVEENYLYQFLTKYFRPIYEKKFLGLYDQPNRKDFYFIGEYKNISNLNPQSSNIPIKNEKPVIHFVYSGDPKNDNAISAPGTITNKLYRYFEKHYAVKYYNLDDVSSSINVGENDIIIGHPHPDENTVIKRLFSKSSAGKYLLWPLHTRIPEINRFALELAEKAHKLFIISGPYWLDTIERTDYGYLKNKIVRLDNAIDSNIFPMIKNSINSPGERGLFVLGRSGIEKGTKELFNLLMKIDCPLLVAGHYNAEDISLLNKRPKTKFLGEISFSNKNVVDDILTKCDFFINMSISDASPTTLLEAMSLGLIPITTPQCGYYYSSIILLSLFDDEHNIITINNALNMDEDQLKILQLKNRNIIEKYHNWDIFCDKIGKEIFPRLDSKELSTIKSKRIKVAGEHEVENNLTQIDSVSVFAKEIKKIITEIHPSKIIETGTFHGTGTTKIIASSLKELGLNNTQFYSIEVNTNNHLIAKENIKLSNLQGYVTLLNGLSLPHSLLPSVDEIEKNTVKEIEFDDIFVDHKETDRARLYFNETNFEYVEDDLLQKCLITFDYKPDFVLLDSGGHIGNIEFNYLVEKLNKECIIALDEKFGFLYRKIYTSKFN